MTPAERTNAVFSALRSVIEAPETELQYTNPYELVVAVLLSAQCTDARVNITTPAFFARFPDAAALAQATAEEVQPYIASISFPNNKAKHLAALGRVLVEQHGGEVPPSVESIEKLPGCGHKTAEVVASVAFGIPALPVDTHVFRVSNRIGLVSGKTVKEVEAQLKAQLPPETWGDAHHLLILHGRYTCKAQNPSCETCVIALYCTYKARLDELPKPITDLQPKRGKYACADCETYTDQPTAIWDSEGLEQMACPSCGGLNLHHSKTGKTTQKVRDFRV